MALGAIDLSMSVKGKLEAIIYAAEEPVTLEQLVTVLKDEIVAEAGISREGAEPGSIDSEVRSRLKSAIEELTTEYSQPDRGMEIRLVANGYRMATKPEHHDVVRSFVKSLKPPIRLSLPALETLAVIAYKQPVTGPEIGEIRGVDSSGVVATLLAKKLITTAGRKQVIGRPMQYKTSKDFLLRFGLKDVQELPSMEEFEKLVAGELQEDLFPQNSTPENSAEQEHNAAENSSVTNMAEALPANSANENETVEEAEVTETARTGTDGS